jgi:hypothetical protein
MPRSSATAFAAASLVKDPPAAAANLAFGSACSKRSDETPSSAATLARLRSAATPGLAFPFGLSAFDRLAVVFGVGAPDGLAVVIEGGALDERAVVIEVGALDGPANATAPVVPAITVAAAMPPTTTRLVMLLLSTMLAPTTDPARGADGVGPARPGEHRSTRSAVTAAEQRLLVRCHAMSRAPGVAAGGGAPDPCAADFHYE